MNTDEVSWERKMRQELPKFKQLEILEDKLNTMPVSIIVDCWRFRFRGNLCHYSRSIRCLVSAPTSRAISNIAGMFFSSKGIPIVSPY